MMRKCTAFLMVLCLLPVFLLSGQAAEVPDLSRKGSITLQMTYNNAPMEGGALTLSRVGNIRPGNSGWLFSLVDDLGGTTLTEDLNSPKTAENLKNLAKEAKLPTQTAKITGGQVVFADLETGLYLIWQEETDATEGFTPMSAFLISVPQNTAGTYTYDINAKPKASLIPETPTPEPTEGTIPDEDDLPQTGQLNWPVPVLAVAGLGLFALGWYLRFGKKESYEK